MDAEGARAPLTLDWSRVDLLVSPTASNAHACCYRAASMRSCGDEMKLEEGEMASLGLFYTILMCYA